MTIYVLTLFPAMFDAILNQSILGRAQAQKQVEIVLVDIRQFAIGKHHQVDDYQFGGGMGMVLRPEPVVAAINFAKSKLKPPATVILLTPQGKVYTELQAQTFAKEAANLILVCGHYEGFDERIRHYVDLEISIGDYVITGGELAAMVIIDSVTRLLPGVIQTESHINDSFSDNLLDYPVYTKPLVFDNQQVPEVLLSGHHQNIATWRRQQQLLRTSVRRPDLLAKVKLTKTEQAWLKTVTKTKK